MYFITGETQNTPRVTVWTVKALQGLRGGRATTSGVGRQASGGVERPPRGRAAGRGAETSLSAAGPLRHSPGKGARVPPAALGPGATPGKAVETALQRARLGSGFAIPYPRGCGRLAPRGLSTRFLGRLQPLQPWRHCGRCSTPSFFPASWGWGHGRSRRSPLLPHTPGPAALLAFPTASTLQSLLLKMRSCNSRCSFQICFSVFVFPVCRIQLTASHGAEGKEKCTWMLLQCIYSQ